LFQNRCGGWDLWNVWSSLGGEMPFCIFDGDNAGSVFNGAALPVADGRLLFVAAFLDWDERFE
jgi:hypothetical protein